MSDFLYVPPYLNWGLFGTVSIGGSPGVEDDDHDAAWLVDGREKFPLRLTTPDGAITITKAAGRVGIVAICHHLLDAGVIVDITGSVTGQIVIPSWSRNGVPRNAADLITPEVSNATSVVLTIDGSPLNSTDILIGEVVAGAPLVLDPPIRLAGSQFRERQFVNPRATDLSGIPGYSERARSKPFGGSQYYSQTQLDLILEWWDSQDGYAYPIPSLIVPDSANLNDVRLVMLSEPTYSKVGPAGSDVEFLVDLEFTELPRTRW